MFSCSRKKVSLTVILLTLNEEYHLSGVLDNIVDWAQEIFIVDSLSTDRTVDVACEYGVHIVQRPFTNFGDQWNWALRNLPISTPWTLKLDPDERLSDELKRDIEKAISLVDSPDGFSFPRRLWFMGKPLHVKQDVVRLWKTGLCHFADVIVNEQPIIEGKVKRLDSFLEHLDSCNLHMWSDKQNIYTSMEAIMRYRGDKLATRSRLFGTSLERRMFIKTIFYKIPLRYFFLYVYHLIGQGAWLDGRVGFTWARLRTEVYRMCELKYEEMRLTDLMPEIHRPVSEDYDPRILASKLQKELVPKSVKKTISAI